MPNRRFQRVVRRLAYLLAALVLLNVALLVLLQLDSFLDWEVSFKWLSKPDWLQLPMHWPTPGSPAVAAFRHEVPFSEMEPLRKYNLVYRGSGVGSVLYGKPNGPLPEPMAGYRRENATFFSLVRNNELSGMLSAIDSVEARFNFRFGYDWVFANDEPFSETFIKHVRNKVSGQAHFVTIPPKFWAMPPWIDPEKAKTAKTSMAQDKIAYGDSDSYRHMCRFNAGFFYRLPVMEQFRYYWRVEPYTRFDCDMFHTDWFQFMRLKEKTYAFTLAPIEIHKTVVNLWRTVARFMQKYPRYLDPENSVDFVTENGGLSYNLCHYWSNFEIADMDFFRAEAYSTFFDYLDKAGGIYYSRWGDAPIHSIAVSLLLPRNKLYHIADSGYYHKPNQVCPHDQGTRTALRCACNPKQDHTWVAASCIARYYEVVGREKPHGAPQEPFKNPHDFSKDKYSDEFDDTW